ncbi:MAG: protein kinase domain-containing protein [Gemmatimonadales bacterium]
MQQTVGPDLRERLQRVLGAQYRLERELGRGGMGVVYEATDTALERRVAIKAVHPELSHHDAIVRRFLSEARMIAKLRHASIVTVHAAGGADGLLYYVMDQVPGESLRDRLRREPQLPLEDARRITAQLASALDTAARAGLVHRDVKPENILLDAASGRALLTDFGIARAMETTPTSDVPTTGEGVAVGTPTYMSPEQAAGEGVDARSDLYSLGVVAYEMLTGQPPFTGGTRVVVSKHLSERPAPITKLRPDCPPGLADAVMRALEKHPDERWQTGDAFYTALENRSPSRRRKRWTMLAGAAAAALTLGVIAMGRLRSNGPPEGVNPRHSILVLPFVNLRGDSASAWMRDGSVNMLSLTLAQWNDLQVVVPERVHDLLEAERVPENEPIGLEQARRVARHAGVWTVVVGSFERSNDSLHLVARVVDVASGSEVDLATVDGPASADVRPLFDALAAQLLDLTGAPKDVRVGVTAATTRSVDAYRSYLQANDHLNHWNLVDAERDFRGALAHDSTFGLAYYKLALTRGWLVGAQDSISVDAITRAELNSTPLPWREKMMIRAYRLFLDNRMFESRALYEQLIAKDSSDVDAWYGLGDAWFHDNPTDQSVAHFTPSLRAFKRALALDPGYALAFEHVNFILGLASRPHPNIVLLPTDSIAPQEVPPKKADEPAVQVAVERARSEAIRLAQDWVTLQPATPRAHEALLAALLTARDFPGAERELARFRTAAPRYPELLVDEARIRIAQGDFRTATTQLAASMDSLTAKDLEGIRGANDAVQRVASAANLFAYRGNVARAARVIDQTTDLLVGASGRDAPAPEIERDLWQWHRLGELYSAVGAPPAAMRRVWESAVETARSLPKEQRAKALSSGGAAAVGLLTTLRPDASAIKELTAMSGQQPVKEVRALLALQRADSAGARKALAEPEPTMAKSMTEKLGYGVYRRPLAAQAYYILGDYDRALSMLESYEPDQLSTTSFDMRWGMVGRVRLLRGAVLEKLGREVDARRQYQLALEQWEDADSDLRPFVEEAQKGLARLEGRS